MYRLQDVEEGQVSHKTSSSDTSLAQKHEGPEQEQKASSRWSNLRICQASFVSDAVVGLSDGLTVPFALTAALSFTGDTRTVMLGGLAELIAGTIAMGLGGYLGSKSERDSGIADRRRAAEVVSTDPLKANAMLSDALSDLGVSTSTSSAFLNELGNSPEAQQNLLLSLHYNINSANAPRPLISGMTIGGGYLLGGILPLIPYFCFQKTLDALFVSIGIMEVVLIVFGWFKTWVLQDRGDAGNLGACLRSALEMFVVGNAAAGVAMGVGFGLNRGMS